MYSTEVPGPEFQSRTGHSYHVCGKTEEEGIARGSLGQTVTSAADSRSVLESAKWCWLKRRRRFAVRTWEEWNTVWQRQSNMVEEEDKDCSSLFIWEEEEEEELVWLLVRRSPMLSAGSVPASWLPSQNRHPQLGLHFPAACWWSQVHWIIFGPFCFPCFHPECVESSSSAKRTSNLWKLVALCAKEGFDAQCSKSTVELLNSLLLSL